VSTAAEKKKIVHIAKVTGIHGMEKHLLTLLPCLNSPAHEIIFLILTDPRHSVAGYCGLLAQRGIVTHTINIRHDVDPASFFRIVRYLRTTRPALVHTHLIHGDLYGITAAKLAGIPCIISSKHNDDAFRMHGFMRVVNSVLNRNISRVITISEWVRQFTHTVERVPLEMMQTIYYGIEPPQPATGRAAVRAGLGIGSEETVLGIIARLVEQKGHRYLIEAFAKAVRQNRTLRLLIVGSGALEDDLKARVHKAGLEKAVLFTGYRTDTSDLLGAIDIFVHPSLWEGFGLAVLEAMAMGKPVIATRVSALPELIEDAVSGFLVAPKDTAALADLIIRLAGDGLLQQRIGEQARQRCLREFSVERMTAATRALYGEVLASSSGIPK
jgi:glycosyltransferase involved in cell wall biosynthesis